MDNSVLHKRVRGMESVTLLCIVHGLVTIIKYRRFIRAKLIISHMSTDPMRF